MIGEIDDENRLMTDAGRRDAIAFKEKVRGPVRTVWVASGVVQDNQLMPRLNNFVDRLCWALFRATLRVGLADWHDAPSRLIHSLTRRIRLGVTPSHAHHTRRVKS